MPKSLRRFALGHIKSEMKVKLTKEKGLRRLLNALQLFIFGGINYTEGLEDSTYHEVSCVCFSEWDMYICTGCIHYNVAVCGNPKLFFLL